MRIKITEESVTEIQVFKKRALQGILILGVRRILWQFISTAANVILARILFPNDFGIFAIVSLYITLFSIISDIGLAAAIIQSHKKPNTKELKTIFTLQLLLGVGVCVLMLIFSPLFIHLYKHTIEDKYLNLFLISSLYPLLYNLKLIPLSILERNLEFKKAVFGEIAELIVQQVATVFFAILNYGPESFILGLVISRIFSAVIFNLLQPWQIGIDFSFSRIKRFLSFGVNFQINNVIGTIGGSISTIVVGGFAGTRALGLVNWAGGVGSLPRAIGEVVGRVVFSAGSRAQKDKILLKTTFERAIQLTCMVTFPLVAVMIALVQPITFIIFTGKWADGIGALYLFIIQSVFIIFWTFSINALLSLGKARQVRNINILWTSLQWLLVTPFVKVFGFIGFPIASLISSFIFVVPLRMLKKEVNINFTKMVIPYLIFSALAGMGTFAYITLFPIESFLELVLSAVFGLLLYGAILFLFQKEIILIESAKIYKLLTKV